MTIHVSGTRLSEVPRANLRSGHVQLVLLMKLESGSSGWLKNCRQYTMNRRHFPFVTATTLVVIWTTWGRSFGFGLNVAQLKICCSRMKPSGSPKYRGSKSWKDARNGSKPTETILSAPTCRNSRTQISTDSTAD